jgi:hypothetical protein
VRPISILLFAVASLSLAQTPIAAPAADHWSDLHSLPADATVRVQTASKHPTEGRLAGVTDDALVVTIKHGRFRRSEQTLPRASVISVSLMGKDHRGRHTLIGFAIGAGVGLGIGEAYDAAHQCAPNQWFCLFGAPLGKEILGPAGALIGTAIGAAMPGTRWRIIYTK